MLQHDHRLPGPPELGHADGDLGDLVGPMRLRVLRVGLDLNLEAYVGFYNFSYDDSGPADFANLNSLLVGARWKF
ncbi:MAG: hypothetical protein WD969_15435 [Paracoccaceae bacterium]